MDNLKQLARQFQGTPREAIIQSQVGKVEFQIINTQQTLLNDSLLNSIIPTIQLFLEFSLQNLSITPEGLVKSIFNLLSNYSLFKHKSFLMLIENFLVVYLHFLDQIFQIEVRDPYTNAHVIEFVLQQISINQLSTKEKIIRVFCQQGQKIKFLENILLFFRRVEFITEDEFQHKKYQIRIQIQEMIQVLHGEPSFGGALDSLSSSECFGDCIAFILTDMNYFFDMGFETIKELKQRAEAEMGTEERADYDRKI